jgi:5-methylcytosine-specific restriction endonuclease McrA
MSKHDRRAYDRDRNREPGRRAQLTARYGRFKVWFLNNNPLCNRCNAPAEVVHHVRKLRDHLEDLCNQDHCEALCKRCHDRATAAGE